MRLFSERVFTSAAHVASPGSTEPGGSVLKWATVVGDGLGPGFCGFNDAVAPLLHAQSSTQMLTKPAMRVARLGVGITFMPFAPREGISGAKAPALHVGCVTISRNGTTVTAAFYKAFRAQEYHVWHVPWC